MTTCPEGGYAAGAPGVPLTRAAANRCAVSDTVTGTIATYPSTASTLAAALFTTVQGPGVGSALAWNQGGALIVANGQARTVGLYLPDTTFDGGRLFISPISPIGLPNPDATAIGSDFGAVVTTGNVTPDFSEETRHELRPARVHHWHLPGRRVLRAHPRGGLRLRLAPGLRSLLQQLR